jgi:hypothetical protein
MGGSYAVEKHLAKLIWEADYILKNINPGEEVIKHNIGNMFVDILSIKIFQDMSLENNCPAQKFLLA